MNEADVLASAQTALQTLRAQLLASLAPARPWTGRLSSSAVATSLAVSALRAVATGKHDAALQQGCQWLVRTQRNDGGWGDTPDSPANLTATLLTWLALEAAGGADASAALARGTAWLEDRLGSVTPEAIASGVIARYGGDRTFSAPILALAALSGRLGPPDTAWDRVPQLPLELAALPASWFRRLRLTVVSYALPALISVGLVRHRRHPSRCVPWRRLRDALEHRLLERVRLMQPEHGGFEEATPLTAFVTLCLAAAGHTEHPVVTRGLAFLLGSQRADGSWPIDTDLATWVTVHSVLALTSGAPPAALPASQRTVIARWLLDQQHTAPHPLTFGAPGGWGWTDLPGAMPDADDTAGVLLALRRLGPPDDRTLAAARRGVQWLLDLQNRDGGIPTFARGWGRLPFDRSCPDLTAHALHAWLAWYDELPLPLRRRVSKRMRRMFRYLDRSQSSQGSWIPLWFGTQATPDEHNHVYGTARTCLSLNEARKLGFGEVQGMLNRGYAYLAAAQNSDGGWGAEPGLASAIEETALAVTALADSDPSGGLLRGTRWLVEATQGGRHLPPAPIGLYFARLWYAEEAYPVVFTATALAAVLERFATARR